MMHEGQVAMGNTKVGKGDAVDYNVAGRLTAVP